MVSKSAHRATRDNAADGGLTERTPPVLFDAVLVPHRSLTRRGFCALMLLVAAPCLAMGCIFLLIGAWPITGFLGLDVALVWLAFRINYRSGRLRETLALTERDLTVRRIQPSGRTREWRFQPYWLRVEVEDADAPDCRLTLSSHGRRLIIGAFLTAEERLTLANALRSALRRLRCLPEPQPQPRG